MPNRTIHQKTSRINSKYYQGLRLLTEHYKAPAKALIRHLRQDLGYSYDQIADLPGFPFTKEGIRINYIDKESK